MEAPQPLPVKPAPSLIVTQPVRSGQTLFFPDGDVTVVGSVAWRRDRRGRLDPCLRHAARPRACRHYGQRQRAHLLLELEAELLSIDGYYKTAEDTGPPTCAARRSQIWLDDETLKFGTLA